MLKILLLANFNKENYISAVESCNAQAIVKYIPDEDINYDGLILCGGKDLDPYYYGQALNGSKNIDIERDRTEMSVTKKFLRTGKPILGICRGMQLLNVALGGTLIQHIPDSEKHRLENETCVHEVIAQKNSIFENMYGKSFFVNSIHHQAVGKIGQGLNITLRSVDGIIEGYEHIEKPYLGVQWHPERMCLQLKGEDMVDGKKIFEYFIKICEQYKR